MLQVRLKKGDAKAFEEIYNLYFDAAYALAFKYTGSASLSSDIVQDVFVKLWEKRDNVAVDLPIKQQIFVITKNTVYDYFRKKINEEKLLHSYEGYFSQSNAEEKDLRDERLKRIFSVINQLPKRQRQILELSKLEGLTYEEIANKLEISRNTVSSHMTAALKVLKKRLSSWLF